MPGQAPSKSRPTSENQLRERLQPGAAFPIKQYAAFARRAQQPFAGAVIPKPKRSATNGPVCHAHVAAWTLRRVGRVHGEADGAFFFRGVFRKLGGHQ